MRTLSDIKTINAVFVEADIEDVTSFFRGHFLWVNYTAADDPEYKQRRHTIVRGEAAQAGEQIGHVGAFPLLQHQWARNHYAVWGYVRVSRIASNPNLIMVEYAHDWDTPLTTPDLAKFTGAKTYEFQSWTGLDKRYAPLYLGVSETLCMRLSPCGFDGSFIEPFWV